MEAIRYLKSLVKTGKLFSFSRAILFFFSEILLLACFENMAALEILENCKENSCDGVFHCIKCRNLSWCRNYVKFLRSRNDFFSEVPALQADCINQVMDTYPGNFRNYQSSLFQIILGGLLEKHEISSFFASFKIFCVSAQGILFKT